MEYDDDTWRLVHIARHEYDNILEYNKVNPDLVDVLVELLSFDQDFENFDFFEYGHRGGIYSAQTNKPSTNTVNKVNKFLTDYLQTRCDKLEMTLSIILA